MSLSPYSRAALDKKQEGCLELFFFCSLLRALCRAPLKPLMHPVHLAWQSCETQDHRLGRQQLHLLIKPMFTLHLEDKRALTNVAVHALHFLTNSGYTPYKAFVSICDLMLLYLLSLSHLGKLRRMKDKTRHPPVHTQPFHDPVCSISQRLLFWNEICPPSTKR